MEGETAGIGKKYGLRQENFILNPLTDTDCFARIDIDTRRIAESLDTDLVTGLAPKRLMYGLYGGGKTHTLMRTMKELQSLTDVYPVRVECPDLAKNSKFHDLYREGIMRALGQDFIIGLVEETIQAVGWARRDELLDRMKEKFQDEEISKAAIRIIDPNFDPLRLWRWLSGASMQRADLDDLGQTQALTQAEAARLADIICMFGRLLRELRGQTLVLVLDEMERLKPIGPEPMITFISGFTRLVDPNQTWVSILMGVSTQLQEDMVELFSGEGPVVSRLTAEAQIEIPALPDPDVDRFIKGVIAYIRDPEANLTERLDQAGKDTGETLDPDLYPFTEDALENLKSHLTQMMTPREITMKMTRAIGRAYRTDRPVVTADLIV